MNLTQLKTPCALVDLDRVTRNTAAMSDKLRRLGVRLRGHVKTHKCVEAARLQTAGHFGGITVSTIAEARHFAANGFRDITYAFPVPLDRLEEIAELTRELDAFHVLIDHENSLKALEREGSAAGIAFSAFLKVDCGDHRAGVDPASRASIDFARRIASSERVSFAGLLTHAGHSYACRNRDEILNIARAERDVMCAFRDRLKEAGVAVPVISIGSTPTIACIDSLAGIQEVRPGNYVFFDVFQAAIGSCAIDDIAFSVLATVVGHYPEQNKFLINAGSLALSKDPGPTHVAPTSQFGLVCDEQARPIGNLDLFSLSQEHGQVRGLGRVPFERLEVGSRVRILPNHSCLSAAAYDRYHVVRGEEVVGEWRPAKGW